MRTIAPSKCVTQPMTHAAMAAPRVCGLAWASCIQKMLMKAPTSGSIPRDASAARRAGDLRLFISHSGLATNAPTLAQLALGAGNVGRATAPSQGPTLVQGSQMGPFSPLSSEAAFVGRRWQGNNQQRHNLLRLRHLNRLRHLPALLRFPPLDA